MPDTDTDATAVTTKARRTRKAPKTQNRLGIVVVGDGRPAAAVANFLDQADQADKRGDDVTAKYWRALTKATQ